MPFSQGLADELLGLMQGAGNITTKKMFGALAYYHGLNIVACLMDDDVFHLRAKGAFADELKANGSKPFVYQHKKGRTVAMPYWTAPQACLDDADEMAKWVKKAMASAANDKKPAKKKKSR